MPDLKTTLFEKTYAAYAEALTAKARLKEVSDAATPEWEEIGAEIYHGRCTVAFAALCGVIEAAGLTAEYDEWKEEHGVN